MSRPEIAVLRRAAEIVETSWAAGATNALDAQDRAIPLFADTAHDTGRATLNSAAVKFSIYGAIVKASGEQGVGMQHDVWELLTRIVRERGCRGGISLYNAREDVTAVEAKSLLLAAASELEPTESPPTAPVEG